MVGLIRKIAMLILATSFLLACSKDDDDETDCPAPIGNLMTTINGTTIFDARLVVYDEFPNNEVMVTAIVLDNFCLLRSTLSINLERELGRQELKKEKGANGAFAATSNFSQIDEDAVVGRWDVYEDEPGWVELDEIDGNTIRGKFNVTYLIRENPNNFQSLSDTLRLTNVSFEADFSGNVITSN